MEHIEIKHTPNSDPGTNFKISNPNWINTATVSDLLKIVNHMNTSIRSGDPSQVIQTANDYLRIVVQRLFGENSLQEFDRNVILTTLVGSTLNKPIFSTASTTDPLDLLLNQYKNGKVSSEDSLLILKYLFIGREQEGAEKLLKLISDGDFNEKKEKYLELISNPLFFEIIQSLHHRYDPILKPVIDIIRENNQGIITGNNQILNQAYIDFLDIVKQCSSTDYLASIVSYVFSTALSEVGMSLQQKDLIAAEKALEILRESSFPTEAKLEILTILSNENKSFILIIFSKDDSLTEQLIECLDNIDKTEITISGKTRFSSGDHGEPIIHTKKWMEQHARIIKNLLLN